MKAYTLDELITCLEDSVGEYDGDFSAGLIHAAQKVAEFKNTIESKPGDRELLIKLAYYSLDEDGCVVFDSRKPSVEADIILQIRKHLEENP
jgi:hypothetical protein